jgi:hypothetical protein
VAERGIRDISDAELARRVDEAVGFVQCFEGAVFRLDGVDFRDYSPPRGTMLAGKGLGQGVCGGQRTRIRFT